MLEKIDAHLWTRRETRENFDKAVTSSGAVLVPPSHAASIAAARMRLCRPVRRALAPSQPPKGGAQHRPKSPAGQARFSNNARCPGSRYPPDGQRVGPRTASPGPITDSSIGRFAAGAGMSSMPEGVKASAGWASATKMGIDPDHVSDLAGIMSSGVDFNDMRSPLTLRRSVDANRFPRDENEVPLLPQRIDPMIWVPNSFTLGRQRRSKPSKRYF